MMPAMLVCVLAIDLTAYLRLDGTQLDLRSVQLEDEDLSQLEGKAFSRVRSALLAQTGVGDAALEHLAKLPLEQLDLNGTKITDEGLGTLRGLNLRALDLSNTAVTDAGLKHLTSLPLERLTLSVTQVTDEGLGALQGGRLRVIDLSHTAVTDQGVGRLSNLPRLEYLDLSHTQAEGRIFESHAGFEALRLLGLEGMVLPPGRIEKLKEIRPGLRVLSGNPDR